MAYETGTATGPIDLLQKLATFLGTVGWTINHNAAITDGHWINVSHASAGYFNVYSNVGPFNSSYSGNWVTCRMASSYNGSLSYGSQPDIGAHVRTNYLTGPYTAYHFFAEATYCHVVVEVTSGHYRHFGFGILNKGSTWTGGEYCYGTTWNDTVSFIHDYSSDRHILPFDMQGMYDPNYGAPDAATRVRTNIDSYGILDQRCSQAGENSISYFFCGMRDLQDKTYGREKFLATPNQFNGLSPLLPILPYLKRPAGNGYQGFFGGEVRNMRFVNMTLFSPGQTITIGTDEWLVFPAVVKDNPGASSFDSWMYGYAYKKVT